MRLVALSLAWIMLSLVLTGGVLTLLFRAHIGRHFDRSLQDHLEELAAAAEIQPDGGVKLTWEPADPRFKAPFSGWYWELRAGSQTLKRSPSLLDHSLNAEAPGPGKPHVFVHVDGPQSVPLRVIAQDIVLPEAAQPFTVLVAGPCQSVRQDVLSFVWPLALSLAVLGLSLAAAVTAQVVYGLRPLRHVRTALTDVIQGRRARLDVGGPAEVAPLIQELNGLLDQREAMVERARAEAGDLAHALKTPIAVIANEARELPGERGETLKAEAARMGRVVEHHLLRARAGRQSPNARASLDRVMDDVRFSLSRVYPQRTLRFDVEPGLTFAGAEDDLGEMIGNLADNACKWARDVALIRAVGGEGRLKICVEDDGPGLSEAELALALDRGERLNAKSASAVPGHSAVPRHFAVPGHGLGLSIVSCLAGLHGGGLSLGRSRLGGLSAELELPAA
jgi:signal transduction histidine kinase